MDEKFICDHCGEEAVGHMVRGEDGCHMAPPDGWVYVRSEWTEPHRRWGGRRLYFYECPDCYDGFP